MGITQKFTEVKREIYQLSQKLNETENIIEEMSSMTGDDRLQEINELADNTIQRIQTYKNEISDLQNSAVNIIKNTKEDYIEELETEASNITSSAQSEITNSKTNAIKEITSSEAVSLYKIENKTNESVEDLNEQVEIAREYAEQAEEYAEQAKGIAEATGLATKEDLDALCTVPLGGIIRSSVSVSDKFHDCDGSVVNKANHKDLYNERCYLTFYRLNNVTRTTYDDNGNVVKRFFFNNLWTTDKDICKRKNPDLKQLYREIRQSAYQYHYVSPAQMVANEAYKEGDEYYYFYGYDNLRFCHIDEDITMEEGVITSKSGFYDGTYEVREEHYTTRSYGYKPEELFFIENEPCDVYCVSHCDSASVGFTKLDGFNNTYTAVETDRKISDSLWLNSITDGKEISFSRQDETGTWTVFEATTITTDSLNVKTMPPLILSFEFVTPPTFVADRDIFYGYRSLIFRVTDAAGLLSFYMAGYKSSSSLKWRHGDVNTGIYLNTNTKYRLKFFHSGYNSSTTTSTNPSNCLIVVSEYDEYGYAIVNEQTYYFTSIYCPYNYYSSYGLRTIYQADASAWVAGQMLDMYSIYFQYLDEYELLDSRYGFEINENNEVTHNGELVTGEQIAKIIVDYWEDKYIEDNNLLWVGEGVNELIRYDGNIFLPKITNSYCDRYYVRVK